MAQMDFSSIIISSKVSLHRNLSSQPFPSRIGASQGLALSKKLADEILPLGDFKVYTLSTLPRIDCMVMHEKNLITRELIEHYESSAVMLNQSETIAVMLGGVDHIELECSMKGLLLGDAYHQIAALDDAICSKLDIAFDDSLGFLSGNISCIGTGMKAKVVMFLPGLVLTGALESLMSNLATQGMVVSGVYGVETQGVGYMFEISNARSLGLSEREILSEVASYAYQIAEAEMRARNKLKTGSYDDCLDVVQRAWGVLTNAHKISISELMKLAGELKMGMSLGLIALKDPMMVDKLITATMPYTIQKSAGTELGELERDKMRAVQVSRALKNIRIK